MLLINFEHTVGENGELFSLETEDD